VGCEPAPAARGAGRVGFAGLRGGGSASGRGDSVVGGGSGSGRTGGGSSPSGRGDDPRPSSRGGKVSPGSKLADPGAASRTSLRSCSVLASQKPSRAAGSSPSSRSRGGKVRPGSKLTISDAAIGTSLTGCSVLVSQKPSRVSRLRLSPGNGHSCAGAPMRSTSSPYAKAGPVKLRVFGGGAPSPSSSRSSSWSS